MASSVALNGRFSGTLQPTGTQTAAFHLFDAIIRAPDRQIPLVVFADPRFPGVASWSEVKSTRLIPVPFSHWSRGRAQLWEQLVLPQRCKDEGAVIAHHPMTTSPSWPRGVRSVVTLHDLNFLLHPEWYSRSFRSVYQVTALPGLRAADVVIAISDYVRAKAERELRPLPKRTLRIYNGVKPLTDGAVASQSDSEVPYVLSVGSLQPHKNLSRIVDAYAVVAEEWPTLELRIVGRKQPRFREGDEFRQKDHPRVKFLGYLTEEELGRAYRQAAVFCYPSLEEGFGLPVLEAMQAGAPVVTSNCSCLPEIAGGAAELVDPCSTAEIADALRRILNFTPTERAQRISTGQERARLFSWKQAAKDYLRIYAEMLASRK